MTLEKNLTARPLYVRKKEFYHQWVWGKTFFPRQITHTTHGTPPTPHQCQMVGYSFCSFCSSVARLLCS